MKCKTCGSDRVMELYAHARDCFSISYKGMEYDGYMPYVRGIGHGDDISIDICLECGQIQGMFPKDDPDLGDICDE